MGQKVLHSAVQSGRLDLVRWLVKKGKADVNARGLRGQTSLHVVAELRCLDLVKCLVEEGDANVDIKDNASRKASDLSETFDGHWPWGEGRLNSSWGQLINYLFPHYLSPG